MQESIVTIKLLSPECKLCESARALKSMSDSLLAVDLLLKLLRLLC